MKYHQAFNKTYRNLYYFDMSVISFLMNKKDKTLRMNGNKRSKTLNNAL